MNVIVVMRYTILVVSAAAMVLGILIMAGVLVPRNLPEQFRVVIGALVLLYGLYRFVVAFFRQQRR